MPLVILAGISNPDTVRALAAVAALWDVTVESREGNSLSGGDGIVFGPGFTPEQAVASSGGRPFLAFASAHGPVGAPVPTEVTFANLPALPQPLAGQRLSLSTEFPVTCTPVAALSGFSSGATIGGQSIWQVASTARGLSLLVGTPPPSLPRDKHLSEILNGEIFLEALPPWLFFRALASGPKWTPAPYRACLIVDDPNLHFPGYGHIDYAGLVEFARTTPFHAAMATVPLDSWFVNSAAARIFRKNPGALSLHVHGNNHLHYELAHPFTREQRAALVRQSLERTSRTEAKGRVAVDRVMAPPHGVCAPEMMELLWRGGFDGMTTNRWSLWKHTVPTTLPADSGFRPADWLAGGLPVVPRFRFLSSICRNEIVFAALFGQPIIPYGHHLDFVKDMAAVRETVAMVNALGPVKWMSMREVLETNFESLVEQSTLRLRLFSRRIKGILPPGITRLQVELPPGAVVEGTQVKISWQTAQKPGSATTGRGEAVALPAGASYEVQLVTMAPASATPALPANTSLRLWGRRLASEARDRLQSFRG